MMTAKSLLHDVDLKTLLLTEESEGIYLRLDELLTTLSDLFLACSNEFSNTYFAHYGE